MQIRINVLIFCFLHVLGIAQSGLTTSKKLKFKHYSLTEGLSQSSVMCIMQDRKGVFWFGTRDGLNKFDGHTFKIYRYDSENPNSLSSSSIKSLFEDRHGQIWIGTQNGLNKFNPNQEQFERVLFSKTKKNISENEIWSIEEADKNHLWIGTNLGLKNININSLEITDYKNSVTDTTSLYCNEIRALLKNDDGTLWVYTTKNIDLYIPSTKVFKHYKHASSLVKNVNRNYSADIFRDSNKTLWVGYKNGLTYFNPKTNTFELLNIPNSPQSKIIEEVRAITEDNVGNLWVGTYKGICIINKDRTQIVNIKHDDDEPTSLSQNSVYSLYKDTNNGLWIGTYFGGVNYYDKSIDVFKFLDSGPSNRKLNYKVVSAIIEDENTNLWIGTEGGGINLYNNKTQKITYIKHNPENSLGLSDNNVKALILDKQGYFWVGTHNGGLNLFNPKVKPYRFKKYKHDPNSNNSISNNRVISLLEDYKSNIWIGTSGGGLNKLNPKTNKIQRFPEVTTFVGNVIFTIVKSKNKNSIYVGGANGLCSINIETNKVTPVYFNATTKNFNITSSVIALYQDDNLNLWIGTDGEGLYYYNTALKKGLKYGTKHGLPSNVVYGILPDSNGYIWLSTNHGLAQFNLITYTVKVFDTSDGLLTNEFNYGAYLKLKKGDLVFGGVNGMVAFNPKEIKKNTFIPPVSITAIQVNNKPVLKSKNIRLNYNQNVLNFSFVALSYSKSSKNEFAHKLEGFDTDWNYIGTRKTATYTNLDPGHYVFKVKASNCDGIWNEQGEIINIEIKPALWVTWWAKIIYIILVLISGFFVRKYSLIRIQEKKLLKQERAEKERIEALNKMKLQLFTNISHDFRTPLTLIIGPLERMLKKKMGNEHIQKQHQTMYRNTKVLLQLINQFLDFRKSETGQLQLKVSKQNMVKFIKNVRKSFDELARQKNITYTFTYSHPSIKVWFDKVNFKKVLYNLLSNAFKNTPENGEILINLNKGKNNRFVEIQISDTGKGIPKDSLEFIFDRYFQLGKQYVDTSSGIGLALTKNLILRHRGQINVVSDEGQGSTFTIQLPIGKSHFNSDELVLIEKEQQLPDHEFVVSEIQTADIENESDATISTATGLASTILIVEDNVEVRQFIKSIFKSKYIVLEAENGKIGLQLAKSEVVDLIISDIMMPEMDGVELCSHIKTNIITSHIPVLLLTARTAETYQKTGYKTGADAYITKPFDVDILEIRVDNLLKSRQQLIDKFKKDEILKPKELTVTSADEKFLEKAIVIVEKHLYDSSFTIDRFVDQMHMSRSALYRKFKALTNQSTSEFIKSIKLKHAAQLLKKTDMTISEVAFQLGYNDLKHFRKLFKSMFKQLPSEYKSKS